MWKKFTFKVLVFTGVVIVFIGVFNWLIDPYCIFQNKNIGKYKTNQISSHLRLFKSIAIRHQNADILLFGDSQVERGINTDKIKKITNNTIFNGSFSSMAIYECRKYLELAIKYNKPKIVVVGLQMYDFTKNKFNDDYKDEYLDVNFNQNKLVFSADAFKSSIKVMKQQIMKQKLDHSPNGLWFDESDETYIDRFIANEKHYIFDNAPKLNSFMLKDSNSTFDEYVRILNLCQDNNITLILFISPSHARQCEATDIGNGWNTFEFWKKQLVILNEKVAKNKGKAQFAVWDFSGYNHFTAESVPNKNDKTTKMKYYYESSHYTPALGDIVIERMFDGNFSGGQNYQDFGVKLTKENIESHLEKLRIEREIWRKTHPKDVAEMEALKR